MPLSSTQVKLTWEASTDNVGVKDYVLRREGVDFQTVDAPTLTFTDTNAVPGSAQQLPRRRARRRGQRERPFHDREGDHAQELADAMAPLSPRARRARTAT